MTITEILTEKLLQGTSPPFIILSPHGETSNPIETLDFWVTKLVIKYLCLFKNITPEAGVKIFESGHPDMVTIHAPDNGKNYSLSVNHLDEIFSIQSFKNWELPSRVIIVERADLISETYANKLLKTLEEPQPGTSIFFLNPLNKKLLQTIRSRAIALRLPAAADEPINLAKNIQEEKERFLSIFAHDEEKYQLLEMLIEQGKGIQKLSTILKADHHFKEKLLRGLVQSQYTNSHNYSQQFDFLQEIQWFQKSKIFHGMEVERFYGLLRAVFPLKSGQDSHSQAY